MASVERGYASLMGSRLTLHYNLGYRLNVRTMLCYVSSIMILVRIQLAKVHRCKNGSESTLAVCVDLKQKLPGQDEVSCL